MRLIFIVCTLFLALGAQGQTEEVQYFSPSSIDTILAEKPDEVYAFSFWASWCAPCIKEMKLLQKFEQECNCQLNLYFVNVEEADRREKALKRADKSEILEQLYFVEHPNSTFYSEIEKQWTGTLPALLLIHPKTERRQFFNRLVSRKKLAGFIDLIKNP
ncbi:thioredoxin domain-containing protein [Roseivirga echinicomitans]|uniref:Thioredoxin domain-containing protein n=1 Tax=Roseivirga echinicomitans TaxID=296218 RepID=A0A150XUS0_9BACT|nr:thioredoxin-like domain-containing protein [Roseivirga echinicomitans]KYG82491.1 hypothetical protein AWN68_14650 [Roseivirga echinicomitans]